MAEPFFPLWVEPQAWTVRRQAADLMMPPEPRSLVGLFLWSAALCATNRKTPR